MSASDGTCDSFGCAGPRTTDGVCARHATPPDKITAPPDDWYPDPKEGILVCPECYALVAPRVDGDWTNSDMERHRDWHRAHRT